MGQVAGSLFLKRVGRLGDSPRRRPNRQVHRIDSRPAPENKKTDVAEHPQVFDHVGLVVIWLPGTAGSPFI
jgi:hypothetical protein